jgi:mono/diheme cytochrome c family protein
MRSLQFAVAVPLFAGVALAQAAQPDTRPSDDLVVSGRAIYQQYCAACHGAKGEGKPGWQQRDTLGELPPPPHGSEGHTWKHGDGMLYRIIRGGWRDPFNKTKRLTMPAYKDVLSPGEIKAVIAYLKTLWTPEQRSTQREESMQHPFPAEAR